MKLLSLLFILLLPMVFAGTPERCSFGEELGCTDFMLTGHGDTATLNLFVRNSMYSDSRFTLSASSNGTVFPCEPERFWIASGAITNVNCTFPTMWIQHDRATVSLAGTYENESGIERPLQGEVFTILFGNSTYVPSVGERMIEFHVYAWLCWIAIFSFVGYWLKRGWNKVKGERILFVTSTSSLPITLLALYILTISNSTYITTQEYISLWVFFIGIFLAPIAAVIHLARIKRMVLFPVITLSIYLLQAISILFGYSFGII